MLGIALLILAILLIFFGLAQGIGWLTVIGIVIAFAVLLPNLALWIWSKLDRANE